jgi:threonine synthase
MLSSVSISDDETRLTISQVYEEYSYLLDPHGAVAYYALKNYLKNHPDNKGYFLETAHPVKFFDVVEPVIHEHIPIPESVKNILDKDKLSISMEPAYDDFKTFLLNK